MKDLGLECCKMYLSIKWFFVLCRKIQIIDAPRLPPVVPGRKRKSLDNINKETQDKKPVSVKFFTILQAVTLSSPCLIVTAITFSFFSLN